MSDNEIDWSALKSRADEALRPIPEGEKVVMEITKSEAKRASTSGNPMIFVQLRVVEGTWSGKTVLNNFNVTPDNDFALMIFFRHMAAFGLDDKFFAGNPTTPQIAEALLARRALVTVGVSTWQGRQRNDVKSVEPIAGQPDVLVGTTPSSGIPTPVVGPASVIPAVGSGIIPPVGSGVIPPPPAF